MDLFDYRKQLSIDTKDDEKIKLLKNSIETLFNYSDTLYQINQLENNELSYRFCLETGEKYYNYSNGLEEISDIICKKSNDLKTLMFLYQGFINSINNNKNKEEAMKLLIYYLDKYKIGYQKIQHDGDIFLMPSGDKVMDRALISDTLFWLDEYPNSKIAWIKAIKEYSNNDASKSSNVADLFRKALETFFKEFFSTNKSLENCKSLYGKHLKEKGVSTEISNNLECLLSMYCNFNNDCAKHNDKTNFILLEYLLYQTGNIMRLLLKTAC